MGGTTVRKGWPPVFSTIRGIVDQNRYVQDLKDNQQADGDDLDIFLREYPGPVPSFPDKMVREFCSGTSQSSLRISAEKGPMDVAKAWLEDREYCKCFLYCEEQCRTTHNLSHSDSNFKRRKKKARKRAKKKQPEPTISSPVDMALDIGEHIESHARSYPTRLTAGQLCFHLMTKRFNSPTLQNADRRLIYIADLDPHYIFALVHTAPVYQVSPLRDAIFNHLSLKPSIKVDIPLTGIPLYCLEFHLPYLGLRKSKFPPNDAGKFGNHKPQREYMDVSFLEIEPPKMQDESKYYIHEAHIALTVCGSDNTRWTAYALVDNAFSRNPCDDDEMDNDDGLLSHMTTDPIASDGEGPSPEADIPLWDPRTYYLRIVEIRMSQVVKEWSWLFETVNSAVKNWKAKNPVTLSQGYNQLHQLQVRSAIDWTVKTMEVLRLLYQHCSNTLQAWKRFNSPGGDKIYFADISDPRDRNTAAIAMNIIEESFEKLISIERRISSLRESCKEYANQLELYMGLESNRLNLDSHDVNRQSHMLSHKMQNVALANHETAQFTNQTAALTLATNQIMTPLAVVVALFSTEQQIFGFQRNRKTFAVCLFLLILALKLYTYLVYITRKLGLLQKIIDWMMPSQSQHTENAPDENELERYPTLRRRTTFFSV